MLNDVTIFDFETTGLSGQNDRVIEMAAIRVINGEIVTEFDTLVRLDDRELPPKITEITGIRPEMLAGAMDETIAFKILRNIMGGGTACWSRTTRPSTCNSFTGRCSGSAVRHSRIRSSTR